MSALTNVLLVGFLLHSAHCNVFSVTLPERVEAVRGSCLRIPCSFTIRDEYITNLNNKCRSEWRDTSSKQTPVTFTRPRTEDLTQKNCTTTVYNITEDQGKEVYFRLDCANPLKWTFKDKTMNIKVNAPPTPTLTPSSVSVSEGQSVSVQCSVPVPCLSLPPTLTWSPVLGDIQETLQEQLDKTFVKVSTLTFTASDYKTNLSCSAVYSRENDTHVLSPSAQITVDITYQPRNTRVTVSPSGPVTEHSNMSVSCSSDANPAVQHYHWYKTDGGTHILIGNSPVLNMKASRDTTAIFCQAQNEVGTENSTVAELNVLFPPQIVSSSNCTIDSVKMRCVCETEGNPIPLIQWSFPGLSPNISIISEPLSDKAIRSVLTVINPQWRDPVTLVCHSRNSLGSDRQRFEHVLKSPEKQKGQEDVVTPLLIASTFILMVLVLVLFCVIRTLIVRHNKRQSSPETTEQLPENQDSGVYSVNRMKKSIKRTEQEARSDADPSGSSYLKEQRNIVGENRQIIINKEAECVYAQVKFKPKTHTNQ
ncbi:sialoadhesin-like isoform X2 [Boleophthalmus pectinirostris]|uniref:sialoadhesin-like isoform X2 n=1 Tax=Boleophthalmus pectinirostris TaxID=150288 RepID=UPI00242E11D9|nr:sialoadhesin-like isoform X2 [Boleophthalmus pectinirostris]